MQNTWKPIVAGILNLITSVSYLLGLLAVTGLRIGEALGLSPLPLEEA